MIALLIALPVALILPVWAYVFRDLIKGVDPRSPLPRRLTPEQRRVLAAMRKVSVAMTVHAHAFNRALRQAASAGITFAEAVENLNKALKDASRSQARSSRP